MFEIFTYSFMIYAFVIGILIAFISALISPFVVLSNQSMLADGLAHTSFLGFVVGIVLVDQPIYIALLIAGLSSVLIKFIASKASINNDAAIGIISALSFAIGLIIVSAASGFNVSIEALMTGSILAIGLEEIIITAVIGLLLAVFVIVFYRPLYQNVFDKENVLNSKKSLALDYTLNVLSAFLIVIGVKVVGALLISSLIIFPTLIASQFKTSFKNTIIIGIIVSVILMFLSIYSSYYLNIPTGSTVVVVNFIALLLAMSYKYIKRRVTK